jgi:hypothetical protein
MDNDTFECLYVYVVLRPCVRAVLDVSEGCASPDQSEVSSSAVVRIVAVPSFPMFYMVHRPNQIIYTTFV